MIEEAEFKKLISEITSLQLQLEEANMLLSVKDEELDLLRQRLARSVELRSEIDLKFAELKTMQYEVELQQHKTQGGLEREKDLEKELVDTLGIYSQYAALMQQYTHTQIQLEDALAELELVKNKNRQLEMLPARVAKLESNLADALEEKNELQKKLASKDEEDV